MSSAESPFDPHAVAAMVPEIAQRGISVEGISLPCGQLACQPFESDCIQPTGQSPELAARASGFMIAHAALARELTDKDQEAEALAVEKTFLRGLVDKLSVDEDLNIMTFNSQKVLFDLMAGTGLLEQLKDAGFTMEVTYIDMDWLKAHNTLGNHRGGNAALKALIDRIRPWHQ